MRCGHSERFIERTAVDHDKCSLCGRIRAAKSEGGHRWIYGVFRPPLTEARKARKQWLNEAVNALRSLRRHTSSS